MVSSPVQRYSTSLVIKKLYIKITVMYHFIPTQMVKIKKMDDTKYWWALELLELSYFAHRNVRW